PGVAIYKQGIIFSKDRIKRIKQVGLKRYTCLRALFFRTSNPEKLEIKKTIKTLLAAPGLKIGHSEKTYRKGLRT
ncbi:MAG: hypothetical protein OES64_08860, partial [Desulfobacteraceae bacterium]|nr:hypothetical protein [Desulfobacteraceae bacterium]